MCEINRIPHMRKSPFPLYLRLLCFIRKLLIARRLQYWGGGGFIALSARVDTPQNLKIGQGVILMERVWLAIVADANKVSDAILSIGDKTVISRDGIIACAYEIHIGKEVTFGPRVSIWDHNHGFSELKQSVLHQPLTGKPVVIGDFVWLGANVVVLPGVNIGEGTVVGAGSVVTRDLPPYAVAVGNPARPVRYLKELT